MRKLLLLSIAFVVCGVATNTAQAHLAYKPKGKTLEARYKAQERNLKHARYVCRHGAKQHKKWACKAKGWLKEEFQETHNTLHPRYSGTKPFALPACTMELVNREGGWNPYKWNGGHVAPWTPHTTYGGSGAYGAPQALPGNKMASAGSDWAHNIWTQLKWMIGYVNGRYGGMCSALAFQRANGYY